MIPEPVPTGVRSTGAYAGRARVAFGDSLGISRGGASVETRFPLALNSLHDLRLTLGSKSIVLKGRVAHSRISDVDQEIVTYRSGIEFIEPSERVREVIAGFLDTLRAHRSGV